MTREELIASLQESGFRIRAAYDARTVTAVAARATAMAAQHEDGSWGLVIYGHGVPGVEVDHVWSALQLREVLSPSAGAAELIEQAVA